MNLLDRFKSIKSRGAAKKDAKCSCGEALMTISGDKKDLYFCGMCNKLLYFLESDLEVPKLFPFNLSLFKKK